MTASQAPGASNKLWMFRCTWILHCPPVKARSVQPDSAMTALKSGTAGPMPDKDQTNKLLNSVHSLNSVSCALKELRLQSKEANAVLVPATGSPQQKALQAADGRCKARVIVGCDVDAVHVSQAGVKKLTESCKAGMKKLAEARVCRRGFALQHSSV